VSASEALLDTSAWWEILFATPRGKAIARRYMDGGMRPHASALTLGEIAAKLATLAPERVEPAMAALRVHARVHPVSAELAEAGGVLRAELRRRVPDASLADGIILATARDLAVPLVSDDQALLGMPDVRAP
jgi:predicted nucleic acid-binding protein